YGVVNIDTLCNDLSNWETLYLAGRLQKPVKILRDHPKVRLANQMNLLSAVRVALLLLPPTFTEHQLYSTIAGISYHGDPRMSLAGENPDKVNNIVSSQMDYFRRLYAPLIDTLPNVAFNDPATSNAAWVDDPTVNVSMAQDMDPIKRGNMVRRLPKNFRDKLYFQYQTRFGIPQGEFDKMMETVTTDEDPSRFHRRDGGEFERRIAADDGRLRGEVNRAIEETIRWPSTSQSVKSFFTAGVGRSWRYMREKREKHRKGKGGNEEAQSEKAEKEKKKEE
ncbi:Mitochondrial translocator assembly and maintenance protein 41, partial [Ascosphaera atra]